MPEKERKLGRITARSSRPDRRATLSKDRLNRVLGAEISLPLSHLGSCTLLVIRLPWWLLLNGVRLGCIITPRAFQSGPHIASNRRIRLSDHEHTFDSKPKSVISITRRRPRLASD